MNFNISRDNTFTLSHTFMSEITLYVAQSHNSYFLKNDDFFRGSGVVYNYIHCIYYIFFIPICYSALFFLLKCENVKMMQIMYKS